MSSEPRPIGEAISELIRARGLARRNSDRQLSGVWSEVAGERIASATRVEGLKRGVLQVAVANAAMLNELVSFHRHNLLKSLKARDEKLKVRDIKFRLRADHSATG